MIDDDVKRMKNQFQVGPHRLADHIKKTILAELSARLGASVLTTVGDKKYTKDQLTIELNMVKPAGQSPDAFKDTMSDLVQSIKNQAVFNELLKKHGSS